MASVSFTSPAPRCLRCQHSVSLGDRFCPKCGQRQPDRSEHDSLIGETIDNRYTIAKLIAHGTSGIIYEAEHATLKKRVAIKVISPDLIQDELAVERFRREATSVAQLDSPHMVGVFDFGRTPDDRLYLAMELLEGQTLRQSLDRKQVLSAAAVADIVIQACEGLAEAHSMGILHRDLRPGNLFLVERRGRTQVKILDFGLAKLMESDMSAPSTVLGLTFGNPAYMSPEQAQGQTLTPASDIYALGCIVYEALSGSPPFTSQKIFDVLVKHVKDDMTPLKQRAPAVSNELNQLVMSMLEKKPENRPASADALREAFVNLGLERRGPASLTPPTFEEQDTNDMAAPDEAPAGSPDAPALGRSTAKVIENKAGFDENTRDIKVDGELPSEEESPKFDRTIRGVMSKDEREHLAAMGRQQKIDPQAATRHTNPGQPAPESPTKHAPQQRQSDKGPTPSSPAQEQGQERQPRPSAKVLRPEVVTPSPERTVTPVPSASHNALSAAGAAGVHDAAANPMSIHDAHAKTPGPIDSSELYAAESAKGKFADVPSAPQSATASEMWYAEGDHLAESSSVVSTDSLIMGFDPVASQKRRRKLTLLILLLLVAAAAIGITIAVASGSGEEKAKTKDSASSAATESSLAALANSSEAESSEANSSKTKSSRSRRSRRSSKRSVAATSESRTSRNRSSTPSSESKVSDENMAKANFFVGAGFSALRSGSTSGADESFSKALALNPTSSDALAGRGEVALLQGNASRAISFLSKALRYRKSAKSYTLLGEAYAKQGSTSKAKSAFESALKIRPSYSRAQSGLSKLSGSTVTPSDDNATSSAASSSAPSASDDIKPPSLDELVPN